MRSIDVARCTAVVGGIRCQLFAHTDGQHVAMTSNHVLASRRERRSHRKPHPSEYRTWGEPGGTGVRPR